MVDGATTSRPRHEARAYHGCIMRVAVAGRNPNFSSLGIVRAQSSVVS